MNRLTLLVAVACPLAAGCGGGGGGVPDAPVSMPVTVNLDGPPSAKLSDYHLFTWSAAAGFAFNDRVVPYEVNTALFSDYALKQRAIYVPDGPPGMFDPEQALSFPTGSVIVKTFYFPADLRAPNDNLRLIETRLLVRYPDGWHPLPYIWSADQLDADLMVAGAQPQISFIDETGTPRVAAYQIPQRNQCLECHTQRVEGSSSIVLIGVKARHMNRSYDYGGSVGERNQLDRLSELGVLAGVPEPEARPVAYDFRAIEAGGVDAVPPGDLDTAARAYLDINCAHCHNPNGVQGVTSQLFLEHTNTNPFHLGVCKQPGSAGTGTGGFAFDIVPGSPDTSILYFRTSTMDRGSMMPLIGRSLVHARGAELLHAWIAAMPPDDCMPDP